MRLYIKFLVILFLIGISFSCAEYMGYLVKVNDKYHIKFSFKNKKKDVDYTFGAEYKMFFPRSDEHAILTDIGIYIKNKGKDTLKVAKKNIRLRSKNFNYNSENLSFFIEDDKQHYHDIVVISPYEEKEFFIVAHGIYKSGEDDEAVKNDSPFIPLNEVLVLTFASDNVLESDSLSNYPTNEITFIPKTSVDSSKAQSSKTSSQE